MGIELCHRMLMHVHASTYTNIHIQTHTHIGSLHELFENQVRYLVKLYH